MKKSTTFHTKEEDDYINQTHSYLALRKAVGWIGILLPFVLLAGVTMIFNGQEIPRNISLYYHSGMRDVFVGSVSAIGLFLMFYKGYDRLDNWSGNLAGLFAFGIALFPTVKEGPYTISAIIHFFCAACFFMILSFISVFLFTRKRANPTKRKLARNNIYRICGAVMIACLFAITLFFIFFEKSHPRSIFVYWAETTALVAFGVSWLTKGGTFWADKKPIERN